jgi:hypothetical protein
MTINAIIPTRHDFTGNDVNETFSYTLKITDSDHIKLVHTDADGAENVLADPLVNDTDYTVNGVGDTGGGSVTFPKAGSVYSTLASGEKLSILYNFPIEQTLDIGNTGRIFNESVEDALDYMTVLINQHEELFDRSIKLVEGSTLTDIFFPEGTSAANRATKVAAWDADGTALTLGTTIGEFRGDWVTATAYLERDTVKDTDNGNIYYCNTAHTSTGSLPISSNADVAKWDLLVDTETAVDAASAVAFKYNFSDTTTMADPGASTLRLDNATIASVTNIAFDATSADNGAPDVSDFIASWSAGTNNTHEGYITIRKVGTPATFIVYSLTGAVVDNTGWLQTPVTFVDSSGTLTDADELYVSFSRSGNRGNDAGLDMLFEDTTTDTDQGAGKVWLNNATPASATVLYMDDADSNGTDINSLVDSWDDSTNLPIRGTITLSKKSDVAVFAIYNVTGVVTSASTYSKIAVTYVTGAGSFTDADPANVTFVRSGDIGVGAGLEMEFESTTTDTDQGAGKTWLNNATPSSATVLYMDDVDTGSSNINSFVDSWDDSSSSISGEVTITKKEDTAVFAKYNVTGSVTSASTYSKVAVTYVTGGGSFSDTDLIDVAFVRSGDKGDNGSLVNVVEDLTPQLGGPLDTNSQAINESEGAAVASATTTDIFGGDDGNTLHITGTTQIDDFTDASSVGQWRKIIFDGILTLTHGSGITLPGLATITTAAGDYAFVYADAVDAFNVLYFRADGTALVGGSSGSVANLLINGGMEVAQRGTSFTSATTPANNDDTYTLDRWILLSDGSDIVDVTQQSGGGVNGEEGYIRLDVETTAKKFGILQIIEAKNLKNIIDGNQVVSLSFEAKVTNATKLSDIRAVVLAWDSTADSVTSDIVSAWGAEGSVVTPVANWTAENVAADLGVTTSWVKYAIENIAIDTASTANLAVFIYQNNVATNDTTGVFLEIANVQLEEGASANTFEYRQIEESLALCHRYYQELNQEGQANYGLGIAHATNTTSAVLITSYPFKRITPSISISAAGDFIAKTASGGNQNVTSMSGANATRENTQINIGVAANLVAGNASRVIDDGGGNGRVKVDAEL